MQWTTERAIPSLSVELIGNLLGVRQWRDRDDCPESTVVVEHLLVTLSYKFDTGELPDAQQML